jgi:predicted Na+-dependent transporter
LKQPFGRLSLFLNLSVFGLILGVHFRMFGAIRLRAFAGMFALVIGSFAIGWVLGESGSSNRKTMAFATSVRNVAASLVIATGSFLGTPAVTAALVYGVFQTLAMALVALLCGRLETMKEPIAGRFTVSSSRTDQIFEKTRP